ncbi:MAG: class I SAM-dependent methyltransferase [Candidatus Zixiibacteriota bacterium]|nr:MAG: class I SAM-dependent methyltransferase [candidate division Zixibacteria bacterium]
MLTPEQMVSLQAERHSLVLDDHIRTEEEYVLHLIHTAAYAHAARLVEGKRVLDLGCNTGYGSQILARSAARVTGVDVSGKAIALARKRYAGPGIAFHVIDGMHLPFEGSEFEVVVSFQVIEHIADHARYLGELRRVLAPEGLAVFTTPNARLRLAPGMKPWNEFHVREFDHAELAELLVGYFPHVEVYGLFAPEPVYALEAGRLQRARETAQKAQMRGAAGSRLQAWKAGIKRLLPAAALAQIHRARRRFVVRSAGSLEAFRAAYGVEALFYREDSLEAALDLMAVCGDSEAALRQARERLAVETELDERLQA